MTKLHPAMIAALKKDRELRAKNGAKAGLEGDRQNGIASAEFWCTGLPEIASKRDIAIPGPGGDIRLRIYKPYLPPPGVLLPIVTVIHGGAFIVGSIEQAEPFAQTIAARTPAIVVSIGYRLAPEHHFPAAIEDCSAALDWIQANAQALGGDERRMALAGISAGANLAVASYLSAQMEAQASVLVYGVFLGMTATASHKAFGDGNYGLTTQRMEDAWSKYLPRDIEKDDPQVAVINGDISSLPPTLLLAAECDPLLDDSIAFHDALRQAGVSAKIIQYEGMAHGFITKSRLVPAGRAATETAARFLSKILQ